MIVSNSSPIIILGKQGRLNLLKKCFNKVIISEAVYNEIMQKKETPETASLMKGIDDKWIVVEKTAIHPILDTKNLGLGEKEAISLAAKHNALLLVDDDSAKSYASILEVKAHGILYLILFSRKKNYIGKIEAREIIENMISDGFYISTELYSRLIDLLDSFK